MNLIFDKDGNGDQELSDVLSFLDKDFKYKRLRPDIKLYTSNLLEFIGKEVYDRMHGVYQAGTDVQEELDVIEYMQLFIASKAYVTFSSNNDLTHSTSGRAFRSEEGEKIPWDWQIEKDNASTMKRAYKALDQLILLLDNLEYSEWTSSEAYTRSKELFIYNTNLFHDTYPINRSGQLYYRLVPFMGDFETQYVLPVIGSEKMGELKTASQSTPTSEQLELLSLIYNFMAYKTLGKAYKVFPIEMFPDKVNYRENTTQKAKNRAEVMQYINSEADRYLKLLEDKYTQQQQTFEDRDLMPGLKDEQKYVSV